MHKFPYVGKLGYQNTIANIKKKYYWPSMKTKVAYFIARFIECQKVEVHHKHLTSLLQYLPIPDWKWEFVTTDFISKLPRTAKRHDYIMVVVDNLTKAAHFYSSKFNSQGIQHC